MRRARRFGPAVFLPALLLLACEDGETPPVNPPQRGALVFLSVVHPAVVAAGAPSLLHAGAFVGGDLCWKIDEAHVEVRDTELRLVGTAAFRPSGVASPQALAYDSVDVMVPPLRAGIYVLRADSLADTLVVAPVVAGLVERFAAEGSLVPPLVAGECTTFTGQVLHRLRGVVIDAPMVPQRASCRLYGELAPQVYCQGSPRNALRFRRLQAGVAPPWERH